MFPVTLFVVFALLSSVFSAHALPQSEKSLNFLRIGRIFPPASVAQDFLDAHNGIRAAHNAPPLTWSSSLASRAQFWASGCRLRPTNGVLSNVQYGELIVAGTGDFPVTAAVGTFIADQAQLDPTNPVISHYTQVVWKSTTELGCARATCPDLFPNKSPATLYVCFYNPAGNVFGQLAENVDL